MTHRAFSEFDAMYRQGTEQCNQDITGAREFAASQETCTQETAQMQCPFGDVRYEARNGCEINYLQDQGWQIVDQNGTDGPPEGVLPKAAEFGRDVARWAQDNPEKAVGGGVGVAGIWWLAK